MSLATTDAMGGAVTGMSEEAVSTGVPDEVIDALAKHNSESLKRPTRVHLGPSHCARLEAKWFRPLPNGAMLMGMEVVRSSAEGITFS